MLLCPYLDLCEYLFLIKLFKKCHVGRGWWLERKGGGERVLNPYSLIRHHSR
jgi:hypothetical protein